MDSIDTSLLPFPKVMISSIAIPHSFARDATAFPFEHSLLFISKKYGFDFTCPTSPLYVSRSTFSMSFIFSSSCSQRRIFIGAFFGW